MTTLYSGRRSYYLDDGTGRLWDSPNKITEFDPVTYQEIGIETTTTAETTATVSIDVDAKDKKNVCNVCGYEAKSFAGLQLHKLKKQHFT